MPDHDQRARPAAERSSSADVPFRVFRGFNDLELRWAARSDFRLNRKLAPYFRGNTLAERIVHALADRSIINVKETLESFETFARIRRRLRAPRVADLCCGHGLTGLLFAASEQRVSEVILYDREEHPKADLICEAVYEAAPWAAAKVRRVRADVARAAELLAPHTAIVAVHACGAKTDRVLEAAVAVRGSVAVLPCCHEKTAGSGPRSLRDALGAELSLDIQRTYWLEAQGYRTEWSAIPAAITPKNRILIGLPQ